MNINVIIPIHEYNENIAALLEKAVESVQKQEGLDELPMITVVYSPTIETEMLAYEQKLIAANINNQFIKNEGKTDYQSQVNLGVEHISTDYFSVLEYDDEYGTTYFRNVVKYINSYPEIDVFLTMMIEVNDKNEGIKLTNETVWSQQFVGENGEIGYLNVNALKQYTDFKLSGGIIKKSEFKTLGGFKSNILLTSGYEFLLRALNNASKVYSIPKIGYKHLATREGSLFDGYLKNMPMDERKFWFEVANKEANFSVDRPIDTTKLKKIVVSEE